MSKTAKVRHEENRREVWLEIVKAAYSHGRIQPKNHADYILKAFDERFKADELRDIQTGD